MEEESVYNLVKPDPAEAPRRNRYRSKYPGDLVPTGSTFGLSQVTVSTMLSYLFRHLYLESRMLEELPIVAKLITSISDHMHILAHLLVLLQLILDPH